MSEEGGWVRGMGRKGESTVSWHSVWKCDGEDGVEAASRQVQVCSVSSVGAFWLSTAGKAIASNARTELRKAEMKVVRGAGSWVFVNKRPDMVGQGREERTAGTNNAATATAFNTMIATDVPTRAAKPRVSKWLGQMGSSQALLVCSLLKKRRLCAAQARTAMERAMERVVRTRAGIRKREDIFLVLVVVEGRGGNEGRG